jgi:hypothetical protein
MKFTRLATLCAALGLVVFLKTNSQAQTASDNAGSANYPGGSWTDGANGGSGFGAWTISRSNNGTTFWAGTFIGNPSVTGDQDPSKNVGITGLGTNAFGLYANPNNSSAFVQADRAFSNGTLSNGNTLSLKWAFNWDSGSGGNKGFNLYTGGTNKTEIININNAGSSAITLNGTDVGFGYGTAAMTWTFSQISSNTLRISANSRDGSGVRFTTNIQVSGAPDSFRLYASAMEAGDARQSYFNDFSISNTPAGLDINPPTIALANNVNKVTWVALNSSVSVSTNDVTVQESEGSVTVTVSPTNVVTTNANTTTITYTATDAAGYRASVQRVVVVGNAGSNAFYSTYPVSRTINTLSSDTVGGELWVDGATGGAGAASGVQAWVGVTNANTDPATWAEDIWSPASYVGEAGNNDRYEATVFGTGRAAGTYYYATRFLLGTNGGNTNYFYGGIAPNGQGGRWGTTNASTGGATTGNGVLTVEQGRLVTYTVDMSVFRKLGTFNPSNHTLQVRTGLKNIGVYAERPLTNTTGDLYSGQFPIGGTTGSTNFYKFYWDGPGGLTWEPGIDDRPLVLASTNMNAGTNFFNDVAGRRDVTFTVDMSVQRFKGLFNPSNHTLQVRTGMNTPGYAERALTNTTGDLYSGTFAVDGADNSTNLFKFYAAGTNGLTWEGMAQERQVVLAVTGTNQNTGTNHFGNLVETRKLSFSVDMSGQVAKGNFIPGTHTAAVRTSLDGFVGSLLMNRVGTSSEYSLDYYLDGPLSEVPASLEYKFFNTATSAPNSGFEGNQPGGGNRILAKADINSNNLSTTMITATFVDATPPGSTFAGWAGSGTATNSETVGKYAIGGATNISAASEKPVATVDSNTLSLSAIVRTNDTKLTVVGEAGGSLTNWSTNGVSVTASTNTNGVPEGHQRQVFSVDRANSPTRQFLRLKATLEP